MCWERLADRRTEDARTVETRDRTVFTDDELERPETSREPVDEPVERERELAGV